MTKFIRIACICLLSILGVADLQAQDLYFVDAHSQFDQEVEGSFIIKRMDEGGVYKTILASRGQRSPGDAVVLAKKYPQRIVASVRSKGGPYANNSPKFYKQLQKQVDSGKFGAMAELLVFHAQKGDKADQVKMSLDDPRVQAALKYAKQEGWPFVVHIEFASLKGVERNDYLQQLNKFVAANAPLPIAMIHMGQLPVQDVAALIKAHSNIYFLTSHADPVSAENATQPWINTMDGDKFKPSWKQLISEHPDRFIFAMDNVWAFQWQDTYLRHIKVWRSALADLPPDVANAVAHGNAEKLWKLAPKP